MIQMECSHCKRFGVPVNGRCRYCGRRPESTKLWPWVLLVVTFVAFARILYGYS